MCIKKKDAFFAFFAKNAFPAPVSYIIIGITGVYHWYIYIYNNI